MKNALLSLILLSTCAFADEKVSVKISGMDCGGCVKAVKAKTCQLEGIKSCEVEVGQAEFVFQAKVDEKVVVSAIESAGPKYKVTEIKITEVKAEEVK